MENFSRVLDDSNMQPRLKTTAVKWWVSDSQTWLYITVTWIALLNSLWIEISSQEITISHDWVFNYEDKHTTCGSNSLTILMVTNPSWYLSGEHTIGLLVGQGHGSTPNLQTCSPSLSLLIMQGEKPNLFLISVETCGVIFGSFHSQTGDRKSHYQGLWGHEHFWFLLLNCIDLFVFVSIWFRVKLGEVVPHALMKDCG